MGEVIGWESEQEREKQNWLNEQYRRSEAGVEPDMPEGLSEQELLDFLYLQACYTLGVKPVGSYEGDAGICARVMREGGSIIDMVRAGCRLTYAANLSCGILNLDVARLTVDRHIPF